MPANKNSNLIDKPLKRKLRGFTLIELAIVVAIIGLLASIAIPQYFNYVQQARRADAQVALLTEMQTLERCKSVTTTYVGCALSAATSAEGYYAVALTNPTGSAYTLTATAQNQQADDAECATMTITAQGIRTPSPATTRCWPN